ncbi:hypothetical protein MIDIC_70030 [Alphaproteobacteria bacterium]
MRWAKAGMWQMIFNTLAVDEDNEWVLIDSTVIRAHRMQLVQEQELGRVTCST